MSDRLVRLQVLRDQLTERVAGGPTDRDFAALTARLTDVLAQIEACEKAQPVEEEASPLAQVLAVVRGPKSSGRSA